MAIRAQAKPPCPISVGGDAWVGKQSVKGGSIAVKDLSGTGILSLKGVLRFYFAGGRYNDITFRHEALGIPAAALKIVPTESVFEGGLVNPTRVEGLLLGGYLTDGTVCGEIGQSLKEKHQRSSEAAKKDAEEAIGVANALPRPLFEEAVKNGLLTVGPYARESTEASNNLLKSNLIGADGKLIVEYKQWLKRWQDALKPAKPALQKRSSPRPGL
jgi:hypothetical protein